MLKWLKNRALESVLVYLLIWQLGILWGLIFTFIVLAAGRRILEHLIRDFEYQVLDIETHNQRGDLYRDE